MFPPVPGDEDEAMAGIEAENFPNRQAALAGLGSGGLDAPAKAPERPGPQANKPQNQDQGRHGPQEKSDIHNTRPIGRCPAIFAGSRP